MRTDRLSEILRLVEVHGVVSGGSVMTGRWQTSSTIDDDLKFIAVVKGRARLETNDVQGVVELGPGDVAVLNGRMWLRVDGGVGDGEPVIVAPPTEGTPLDGNAEAGNDVLIGGRIDLDHAGREFLLLTLPPLLHVRAGSSVSPRLTMHVRNIFDELAGGRPGSEFAVRHHGQLLVLEIIRWLAADPDVPPGWIAVLTDESLRPAVALMHERPDHRWGLEDLANAASMSRTTFAERFRRTAGVPPLTYLHDWRMLLAQRALRDEDTSVHTLARDLGYRSESSFSTAFKRHVGVPPTTYRARSSRARRDGSPMSGSPSVKEESDTPRRSVQLRKAAASRFTP